jgi:hypothetical protein
MDAVAMLAHREGGPAVDLVESVLQLHALRSGAAGAVCCG